MRAPFCNETADLCPDDKGIIGSENESKNEIHAIEKSLGKSHTSKSAVFGICLDDLMGTSPIQVDPQIPFILSRLCRYIETHGLHQKSLFLGGEEKNVVENLKVEFIECGNAPLETAGSVASAAKLLLIFFQELPEPLIPGPIQSDFVKDMEKLSISSAECISCLKVRVETLPQLTYQVLKYLSRFLLKVACHHECNGMSSDSLAMIFGPVIFRPGSNDPVLLQHLKCIVNCFVQDYHAIFEDEISSRGEENSVPALQSLTTCRQLPCPSSVMPVSTLSPLSVLIPSMDTSSSDSKTEKESVPVLLIERSVDSPSKETVYSITIEANKEKIGSFVTRKRKERRFSGEDSQQRSSSEERPSSLLGLEKMVRMRRCNSHEEVVDDIKMSFEEDNLFPKDDQGKGDASYRVDSYLSNTMELVVNEKNHSPHPPNAKRREVDTVDLIMESSQHWKYHNLSKFSDYKNAGSRSDMYFRNSSKQNPIAELSEKITMECDSADNDGVFGENEFHDNVKAMIPRSASCPVPKADNEGSESEHSSLSLSWSMLFEDSEPVRSENPLNWSPSKQAQDTALLSPSVHKLRNSNYYEAPLSPSAYRSYLSHRSSHLDPSVPPSPPVEQEDFAKKLVESSGVSDSIKQLTKKIHSVKRHLKKFDEKFEAEFGYKPSHAEKSNNPEGKKLLSDLYKARKELKALKEEAHLEHVSPASSSSWHPSQCVHILEDTTNHFLQENGKEKSKPSVEDSFGTTLKSLADDRRTANRPEIVDDMTNDQVKDEKFAIQKALLHFESIHGKPYSRDERNTIRPLYDRYRSVKKLLVRSGSFPGSVSKNKELCSELQPILEHETMDFPSREHRNSTEEPVEEGEECKIVETEEPKEIPIVKESKKGTPNPCHLTMKYDNSNFHELPLSEMIFQMHKVKSQKRHIRKVLKDFETDFLKKNGRKVQREDKIPMDAIYGEYKHVKARVKLLEALISKHDQHQLM